MKTEEVTIEQDNDLIEQTITKLVNNLETLNDHIYKLTQYAQERQTKFQNPNAKISINKYLISLSKIQITITKAQNDLVQANNKGRIYTIIPPKNEETPLPNAENEVEST